MSAPAVYDTVILVSDDWIAESVLRLSTTLFEPDIVTESIPKFTAEPFLVTTKSLAWGEVADSPLIASS